MIELHTWIYMNQYVYWYTDDNIYTDILLIAYLLLINIYTDERNICMFHIYTYIWISYIYVHTIIYMTTIHMNIYMNQCIYWWWMMSLSWNSRLYSILRICLTSFLNTKCVIQMNGVLVQSLTWSSPNDIIFEKSLVCLLILSNVL